MYKNRNQEESHEDITTKTKERRKSQQTELIGAFGLWQGLIFSLAGLTIIIHAWQMMANKFLTYPLDHWCERPEHYKNFTVEEWLNISSPLLSDGSFDRCSVFTDVYENQIDARPEKGSPAKACNSWEYDETTFQVLSGVLRPLKNKKFGKLIVQH